MVSCYVLCELWFEVELKIVSPFRYNTETVSSEVLSCMKQQMTVLNSSTGNHSFLLDDDATLPFAAADVLNALDDKVRHGCNMYEV